MKAEIAALRSGETAESINQEKVNTACNERGSLLE